jgi:ligand-binding sensor domain-containing protein
LLNGNFLFLTEIKPYFVCQVEGQNTMESNLIHSFECKLGKRIVPVILGISLLFAHAKASFSELTFDIFTQENGLPNNQIQCIYQDSKGWIWIGTSQGLSRFDGYSFVNFLSKPDDSTSLKGNLVRVIKEDRKCRLLFS